MIRLLFALALLASLTRPATAAEAPISVFAAASLKAALTQLSDAWAAQGHPRWAIAFDSSGTLAKQIQQGAPAAIFISADQKWMDYLDRAHLLIRDIRRDLLSNVLVLVGPPRAGKPVSIDAQFNFSGLLGPSGRLAVGDPDTVPAGIYAKQALTKLGLWNAVKARLAPSANVKAALLLVEVGEAPAGIVYATDARRDSKVHVIGTFPTSSHDPITYSAALIAKVGDTATARAALAFIEGPAAKAIFLHAGFGTL